FAIPKVAGISWAAPRQSRRLCPGRLATPRPCAPVRFETSLDGSACGCQSYGRAQLVLEPTLDIRAHTARSEKMSPARCSRPANPETLASSMDLARRRT